MSVRACRELLMQNGFILLALLDFARNDNVHPRLILQQLYYT